ncbi:Maf family nucleotide pyrophosphatase [Microbacterium sp. CFH 31415]|uniref:Maf family protein n=1 Tax=Microbacterium sp. CFH 31415 TaxID=2921732 RepID=UPI001F129E04|nr:Maf family nucleotide pyrophosphatase [Microbacterium sp. CFH 31415]MCH6231384.1 Maf family nucleotide pyrophosphatase [Microbacterium sp. CFH 31415]
MRVCLASTSPARLMLLQQFGIRPLTVAPDVDEDAVVAAVEASEGRTLAPDEHVLLLARRKAADVAARLADDIPGFDGIVIGGDSMFELGGEVLGKPYTADTAVARWHAMRGQTGVLHSGHAVVRMVPGEPAREVHAVAEASVTFADDLSDAEIDAYVASGEPLHVAGAFTVDSLGGAFITRVEGDPSTVVGMSLSTLRRLVRELGVEWTALWATTDPSLEHADLGEDNDRDLHSAP